MIILAINTASSKTAIALLQKDSDGEISILGEKSWQSANDEAEKLMPEIDALLADRSFSDIEEVFVVRGPGSFTGLRVGVTVANTLAYLNDCPLKAIDTFGYCWSAYDGDRDDAAVLIFAGSKGVYMNRSGENTEIVNIDELAETLKVKKVFGDIREDQKEKIGDSEFIDIEKTFGEVTSHILSSKELKNQKMVTPLYVKAPSISKSKKSLFNK